MAASNDNTFLTWKCTKCGNEFGYEKCQYDGNTCYDCAPGDDAFKREQQGWHDEHVAKIKKSIEHEQFLRDLKCPSCKDKTLKLVEMEKDKITVRCMNCHATLHEEKRDVIEHQCPACGNKYTDTKYGEPEYDTTVHASSCVIHGVDESAVIRVKVRNVKNMATREGRIHEFDDCKIRYIICRLNDQPTSVKKAVLGWLKNELKRK